MTLPQSYIGCDISKYHLDLFDPQTQQLIRLENISAAIEQALDALRGRTVFFVYEATGSYDRALRHALADRAIPAVRLNPMMAKRFAQAIGQRAKTDALDARMLSKLGQALHPPADAPPCRTRETLTAWHRLRDQLVATRVKEKSRRQEALCPDIAAIHQTLIATLNQQIDTVESKIAALISSQKTLQHAADLLHTAPGVGPVTVATMLSLLPELGTTNAKTIASLAGLAPFNNDSGRFKGQRTIVGGRARVRKALYLAALSAVHGKSRYNALYRTYLARGKAKKVALIAVARKLLTHLNAMIRDQKQWA